MNDQIIALLAKKNLLDQKTVGIVKDLLARGKTLEQATVGARYVSDVDYARAKAEVLGLPFVDLAEGQMPPETMQLLPQETIETYHVLPLGLDGNSLVVAPLDTQDLRASQALEFLASGRGFKLRLVVAPQGQIRKLLKLGAGVGAEVETALAQVAEKKVKKGEEEGLEKEVAGLQEVIKGAPVARMLTTVMRNAVDQNASDIHIEPFGGESRIRYRVDGVLRTVLTLPQTVHPALIARVKVLANLKLDETRVPQDGRITQAFGGRKIDFRISSLPVVDNEKVVMRILDTSVGAPTLENLGYRPEHVAIVKDEIRKAHGLFLVTGPTGSGKSTTLFACLNMLNSEGVNISTLEDPVEYFIPGVNQSQIRPEIGYTFASGLRSLLRQDPNVIMVGEIRDGETGELAVHAALTGHLIFSTIHTNDAFGVIPRLIDLNVEPFLLSATLNMVIAQRLARKICSDCKSSVSVPKELEQTVRKHLDGIPPAYLPPGVSPKGELTFMRGSGCDACGHSGYSGRLSVAEILQVTDTLRNIILEKFKPEDIHREAERQGMLTLMQDGILKALAGLTTFEEVLRIAHE